MSIRAGLVVLLMAGGVAIAPSSGYADHIFASIDGNSVGPAGHDVCGLGGDPYLLLAADCNGTAKTYGRLVISGAGAGNPARVVVKSDSNQDYLTLTGATIQTNVAAGTTLTSAPLSLWSVPLTQLPNTSTYGGNLGYQLNVAGSFFRAGSKPLNDQIVVDSYLQHPVPNSWLAMSHYAQTMSSTTCPQNNVACNFSNGVGTTYNVIPGFDDNRGLEASLSITIKSGDTLTISSSNGLVVQSVAPGATAGSQPVGSQSTPKSQLSVLCSTTYSTAQMFGCPSCVTEDGQVAENAKVTLFASTNRENLALEMARGEGEHLGSLAALLHVPAHKQETFFGLAQQEYQSLSGQGEAAVEQVIAVLQAREF